MCIRDSYMADAHLVLCEGFKGSDLPRVEVFRTAAHPTPLFDATHPTAPLFRAIVTDDETVSYTHLDVYKRQQWHMRLEATNYFYRVRYPETYFIKTGADDPVLEPGTSRNYWKRNLGLNLGMTYSYGR